LIRIVGALFVVILLAGCGSKRYYEPEKTASLAYSGLEKSALYHKHPSGLTFKDGTVVTQQGRFEALLKPEYYLVGAEENYVIATTPEGDVMVHDAQGEVLHTLHFDAALASARIQNGILAGVLVNNTIVLTRLSDGKNLFKRRQKKSLTMQGGLAAPLFFDDLVLYPTLDGKLVVLNAPKANVIREIVISSEKFFNNVMYLAKEGNAIYAVTRYRAMKMVASQTFRFDATINHVAMINHKLYLATNDGRILRLNETMESEAVLKFPFAGIIGIHDTSKGLYLLERGGHVIKTDRELTEFEVYLLLDDVETGSYLANSKLYFLRRYTELP